MGNACVLKPAEEACLTLAALADLRPKAGFPAGALNVVPGLGEEAGAALAATPAQTSSRSPASSQSARWFRRPRRAMSRR